MEPHEREPAFKTGSSLRRVQKGAAPLFRGALRSESGALSKCESSPRGARAYRSPVHPPRKPDPDALDQLELVGLVSFPGRRDLATGAGTMNQSIRGFRDPGRCRPGRGPAGDEGRRASRGRHDDGEGQGASGFDSARAARGCIVCTAGRRAVILADISADSRYFGDIFFGLLVVGPGVGLAFVTALQRLPFHFGVAGVSTSTPRKQRLGGRLDTR
jgi:hypothetical protein